MIHHVEGTLVAVRPGKAILELAGLGLEILITEGTASRLGPAGLRAHLLTHLVVREDAWILFGFEEEEERALFRLLLGVQGVGPRLALAILSALEPERLRSAVAEGDLTALTGVTGVGKKTAQRVIVDLRDKVGLVPSGDAVPGAGTPVAAIKPPADDVVDALVALGYSRGQAREAVDVARGAATAEASTEEVLREALRRL